MASPVSPAQPSLAPFGALFFAYFATIGLFNPYAPLWFQSLGLSTLAIGAIASLKAGTRVVAPYAWAWVADAAAGGTRREAVIRVAAAVALIGAAALAGVREVAAVTAVVVLIFIANGALVPLTEAALSLRLARSGGMDVGRYGRVRSWGSLGFIAAVLAFGPLLEHWGIGALPACMAAMSALLLAAAWRLPAAPSPGAPHARAAPIGAVLRRPVVAWFFAGLFLTVLAHSALYVFFSLYVVERGWGKSAVGALWAVGVAAEIAFFWTQSRWFARFDAPTSLVVAAAVTALRFAAVAAFGHHALVLALTQLLHAVTFAAQHAACIALIDRYFPGALRARGQALYSALGYGISGVAGGLAFGAVSQRFGLAAVFAAAAGVAAAATLCCWRSRALGHGE